MAGSPEAMLISAVLNTKDHGALSKHGVNVEMFTAYPDEAKWLYDYIDKYQRTPSLEAFCDKWPDFHHTKEIDEADHYSDEVKQSYARSAVTDLLDESVNLIMKGDIAHAMEAMSTKLLRIQATVQDSADDYDVVADWQQTYEAALDRAERQRTTGRAGISSGFPTLDLNTGGFQPGWFCVVGGRLSAGKTWTMMKMASTAALEGYTSMYYTLEQPRDQIAIRSHVLFSRQLWDATFCHLDLMRGSNFNATSYKEFLESLADTVPGRFVVNDTRRGRVSPSVVAGAIERDEPDIVFIDYLTLMQQKGDGGWLSVADLSASIQQMAQRYNIPTVVGAQLNRVAINDDEPDAGTIGRGDSVGQDADLAVFVSKKTARVRKMNIGKNRHGPDGISWYASWKVNTGEIEEISGDEASDLMDADKEED